MKLYDIVIFGNYARDTIIKNGKTRHGDGGGVYCGAYAAAGSGVKVAAVTRLAKTDIHVIDKLGKIGIDVYPTFSATSTKVETAYPSSNVDERNVTCTATAGAYSTNQFDGLSGKAFIISALLAGEVSIELIEHLRKTKDTLLALDVQGFVRVRAADSRLFNSDWPEKKEVLAMIDILKTDAVEAESLTGEKDLREAAKILAGWGPSEIVMTHKNGILVYSDGEFYEAEFHLKEIVGRTGRGDTCFASYISKRLSSPASEAIIWSAAVTSLKMEKEGPFLRTIQDVEELIKKCYKKKNSNLWVKSEFYV